MADDLLELLHGLGARKPTRVYNCTGAAAHRLHRVHVFGVAHDLVVPDAPALGLSFLTVVFCVSVLASTAFGAGIDKNGFFMQLLLKRRVHAVERAKN